MEKLVEVKKDVEETFGREVKEILQGVDKNTRRTLGGEERWVGLYRVGRGLGRVSGRRLG